MTQSSTSNTTIQAKSFGDSYAFEDVLVGVKTNPPTNPKLTKEDMQVVEIELGSHCNLNCPLCHRNWKDAQHLIDGNNQRPVEDIINQLEKFPNLKIITIAGSISEPTLYKQLFTLIKYITSRDVLFYLYTNGDTSRDPEYWKTLGSLCNERTLVYFTICGTTQELHEKYRVGSNLQRIFNNHEAFKSGMKYKNDVLQYLRFEYNHKDYQDNISTIRDRFSRESSIESMAYRERFALVNPMLDPDVNIRQDLQKKYKTITMVGMKRFENKSKCTMDCSSFNTRFVSIDNNGREYPCYMHRIYNSSMQWDYDYTDILKGSHGFCFECEKFTSDMIKQTEGLTRIVEC